MVAKRVTQTEIKKAEDAAELILEKLVEAKGGSRREPQVRLARGMARHHTTGVPLIVSAPTSSGKSLAAFASARASEQPTIIATGTQVLQNQLEEDGIMLAQAVGGFKVAVLKGKTAYFCHLKADQFVNSLEEPLNPRSQESRILDWAKETTVGDKKELDFPVPPEVWDKFSVSPALCAGTGCPFYSQCFNEVAKSRAKNADIAIVNHALVAQGMKQEVFLAEKFKNIIIDEAHEFHHTVGEAYGATITRGRLEWLGNTCRPYMAEGDHAKYSRALSLIGEYGSKLREPLRHLNNHKIMNPISFLKRTLEGCVEDLKLLANPSDREKSALKSAQDTISELYYFTQGDTSTRTSWVEWNDEKFVLRSVLFNPGFTIKKELIDKYDSAIFMSATIKVGGNFKNAASKLGLLNSEWVGAEIPHLIDYKNNGLLWLPKNMKDPGDPGYLAQVARLAGVTVRAAKGRTLVLCTSWASVQTVGERLKKELDGLYPVYVQEPGVPLAPVAEKFKNEENSVLVGTRTLWTGVSFEGSTCSCVIIDKMPFPSPSDPIVAARCEYVEDNGGNAFASVLVPDACLTVTQGAGRLLRAVTDRGLLVIADPRVNYQSEHGKGYARRVLASIPPFEVTRDSDEALGFLRNLP